MIGDVFNVRVMKGCILNKLTIFCLIFVIGGLFWMLYEMWPKPAYPESERFGTYYNPYNKIFLSFKQSLNNKDYQYVYILSDLMRYDNDTCDYIKIKSSPKMCLNFYFIKNSKNQLIVLCPTDQILDCDIVSVHSCHFFIDTCASEKSKYFYKSEYDGQNIINASNYSIMECWEGYVSLGFCNSQLTPLCSYRGFM